MERKINYYYYPKRKTKVGRHLFIKRSEKNDNNNIYKPIIAYHTGYSFQHKLKFKKKKTLNSFCLLLSLFIENTLEQYSVRFLSILEVDLTFLNIRGSMVNFPNSVIYYLFDLNIYLRALTIFIIIVPHINLLQKEFYNFLPPTN